MCGLTGFLQADGTSTTSDHLQQIVRRMADTIRHRGPDDGGEWCDPQSGLALGFRRLAIIDLSAAGHQPMLSASGRYVIAFNGEVYNFEAIREALRAEGHSPAYRGHSDTEVMLAAIEAWGLERAVKKFVGMFAFALWDRSERVLHLVRDRLGVKPMYYGAANGVLLFGSELKPLRAHPSFGSEISRPALTLFLRHCYIPSPFSVYEHYLKLPPGTILSVRDPRQPLPQPKPYWSARQVACEGIASPLEAGEKELTDELESLLKDAISLRMVADVPVGVFLSGGIDSSTVAAIMQSVSSLPVRTFSIGFNENSYDEAPHARKIARHLGTDHTELYVSSQQALDVIPKLPTLYDEPFADSSQIPTYLVSEMARRHVTVSLTGDGGDELFCGYDRYTYCADIWGVLRRFPQPARSVGAEMLRHVPGGFWETTLTAAKPLLPRRMRVQHPADKVGKFIELLAADGMDSIYRSLVSTWPHPENIVIGASEPISTLTDRSNWPAIADPTQRMMYFDLITYLPDDILVKVDRASMGVSLEAREPLIDHRLVEFAWRLPMSVKSRDGVGKWLLRRVLDRYVPRTMVERPKMGFGIPVGSWLRGPLRDWAEGLLSVDTLQKDGFFNPEPVRQRWQEHLRRAHSDFRSELWAVLMFQAWFRETHGSSAAT